MRDEDDQSSAGPEPRNGKERAEAAEEALARRILDARTKQLAARRTDEAPQQEHPRVLACAIGAEVYAVPLDAVAEVLPSRPLAPVVGAPAAVLGLVGLAGRACSVLDLATALGLPGAPGDTAAGEGHLLRLRDTARRIALRVDRVLGAVPAAPIGAEHQPVVGMGGKPISGYALAPAGSIATRETLLGLVDLEELLRPFLALPPASGA